MKENRERDRLYLVGRRKKQRGGYALGVKEKGEEKEEEGKRS